MKSWRRLLRLVLLLGMMAAVPVAAADTIVIEPSFGTEGSDEFVIGQDNRVRVSNSKQVPFRWVCRLTAKSGKTTIGGTAFLVGPDTAVTAAHCVYSRANSKYMTEVCLYPGAQAGVHPYGKVIGTKIYIPESYKTCAENLTSKYDFAVIKLSSKIGNKTGYFGMATIDKNNPLYNTVYVAGYPADKKENGNAVMYFCKGRTTAMSSNGVYAHNVDTFAGESGSPIYIKKNGKYYVIGVHASGSVTSNYGRAFTSYVTGYIKNKM